MEYLYKILILFILHSGTRPNLVQKNFSPGPAAYMPGSLDYVKKSSPQFSIVSRTDYKYKQYGPGPNYYNLMEHKPGKTGQSYSFGVRHGPFAPPMIVPCDNM